MKAVVLGGTGAVGRHVVGQLLQQSNIQSVVTIGRREVTVPDEYKDWKAELKNVVVNMDALKEEAKDAMKDADVVFWTLGTTRKLAGSAAAFKKVEVDYLEAAATLAKESGVKHFSILTAQGANANVWHNDFALAHPMLYTWVKGHGEEFVKALGFPRVSIFRPGLLDRQNASRGVENLLARILPKVKVADVAQVMVGDAVGEAKQPVRVYEMGEIKSTASSKAVS